MADVIKTCIFCSENFNENENMGKYKCYFHPGIPLLDLKDNNIYTCCKIPFEYAKHKKGCVACDHMESSIVDENDLYEFNYNPRKRSKIIKKWIIAFVPSLVLISKMKYPIEESIIYHIKRDTIIKMKNKEIDSSVIFKPYGLISNKYQTLYDQDIAIEINFLEIHKNFYDHYIKMGENVIYEHLFYNPINKNYNELLNSNIESRSIEKKTQNIWSFKTTDIYNKDNNNRELFLTKNQNDYYRYIEFYVINRISHRFNKELLRNYSRDTCVVNKFLL